MKHIFNTCHVLLLIIMVNIFLLAACGTSKITSGSSGTLSIQNTSGYELKNTTISFNQDPPVNVDSLKSENLATVDFPSNTYVTTVHISGETVNGQVFSNTFSGFITHTSLLTIYLDDDMNVCVSSNIDT